MNLYYMKKKHTYLQIKVTTLSPWRHVVVNQYASLCMCFSSDTVFCVNSVSCLLSLLLFVIVTVVIFLFCNLFVVFVLKNEQVRHCFASKSSGVCLHNQYFESEKQVSVKLINDLNLRQQLSCRKMITFLYITKRMTFFNSYKTGRK